MATLVCGGVVGTLKRVQVADDRVRDHDEEGQHPRGRDHPVGVGAGLPHPRLERVADGAVAFDGDGNQAECGDAHRYACQREKNIVSRSK